MVQRDGEAEGPECIFDVYVARRHDWKRRVRDLRKNGRLVRFSYQFSCDRERGWTSFAGWVVCCSFGCAGIRLRLLLSVRVIKNCLSCDFT